MSDLPEWLRHKCPSCGQRPVDTTGPFQLAWRDSGVPTCPRCLRRFTGPTNPAPANPKRICAVCSKRLKKTEQGERCANCKEAGYVADSLF